MPTTKAPNERESRAKIRDYTAKRPPSTRRRLKELADTIRKSAPGAVDAFSYQIPAFRYDGKILVWYAGWTNHLSMYPLSAEDRKFAEQKGYKTSKGTVQFPLDDPLPVSLIKRLVKSRLAAIKASKK
ncbi:MAG TPA: DUF1801 domain-containing protein [Gemmatimonadaceae bacterium]|nr:DUF1801 domain-containing protein [Gemmatimonadaceae bacterium]